MTVAPAYPNLEPNHAIHELGHNGDELLIVVCPFTDPFGAHYESSWSANAAPSEINCLFCEFLNGGWVDHGCADADGDEPR
jgi:hypothetical protein